MFNLFEKCNGCKKKKLFFTVSRREITLPIGLVAKSQDKLCRTCFYQCKDTIKKSEYGKQPERGTTEQDTMEPH